MSYADRYNTECCDKCRTCKWHWKNNEEYERLGENEPCHEYIKDSSYKEVKMADKEKYEKAIRVMQQHKYEEISFYGEEYNLAIKALEEIQKYRSIGTVEECREAVKRQRAKKVKGICFSSVDGMYHGICPVCGNGICSVLERKNHSRYCNYCGQAISLEESEGEDD